MGWIEQPHARKSNASPLLIHHALFSKKGYNLIYTFHSISNPQKAPTFNPPPHLPRHMHPYQPTPPLLILPPPPRRQLHRRRITVPPNLKRRLMSPYLLRGDDSP